MVEHSQILKTNDFLSYRTLIWRRFRKNRMGIIALVILGIFYFSAVFAEYFAPYDHKEIQIHRRHVPPQKIYYNLSDGLYVHGLITTKNPVSSTPVFNTLPLESFQLSTTSPT